uniref:Uncharacterized protein n=1 Tax=Fagus sylvatica TaxID=28930 RepID=A0A2N9HCS7_FAGSY
MRHIVGKLSTSSFQRYKVCANRSSDEGVMAPGSRGIGAVFVHSSGEDSDQTGDAFGEPRVPRRSRSHYLSNAPGLADQLVASRKDSAREGGSCAAYFCKVPDSRESELGLVRYGPASRVHRGVFGPFEGSFPIRIPADPDKFLAIREFHVVHGCVLFPMCPGSQINLLRVRKTLCASAATSVGKFRKFQHSLISSACFHARGRRSSRCRIPTILVSSESLRYLLFNGTGLAQRRAWVREDMILANGGRRNVPYAKGFGHNSLVSRPFSTRKVRSNLGQTWSTLVKLGRIWSKLSKLLEMYPGLHFKGFWARRTLVGLETARSNLEPSSDQTGLVRAVSFCAPTLRENPGGKNGVMTAQVSRYLLLVLEKQLKAGFLSTVTYSDWVANIVPVPKKDGKVRMCVDYRDLNRASPKDNFPLPHIDTLVDNTATNAVFSFMDGFSGYNQIKMAEEDKSKTAFVTHWGTFVYDVMPFGLKNAGATYQRAMVTLFHNMIHHEIEVYMDDMIAKSRTVQDHLTDLRKLFQRLKKYQLRLNPNKCAFGVTSGKLLGFIVSGRGIKIDPAKARFIAQLTATCEPLFKLLRKDVKIKWTEDCQRAFDKIKEYLLNPPILVPPTPGRPLILYLTVQEASMGCMLGQQDETGKKEQAIYYLSKKFTESETRYLLVEKTCCALAWASKKLRQYMLYYTTWLVSRMDPIKYIFEKPAFDWEDRTLELMDSEFPDEDVMTVDEDNHGRWKLYFDGAANAVGSGIGAVLVSPKGQQTPIAVKLGFDCTNNMTEYEACIVGLQAALEFGAYELEVFGDSLLIVSQTNGEWQARGSQAHPISTIHQPASPKVQRFVQDREYPPRATENEKKCGGSQSVDSKKCTRDLMGAHANGPFLARKIMRAGYYWLTMERDCIRHVQTCHKCQMYQNSKNAPPQYLHTMASPWPFSAWGMDVIGAITPKASNGHEFILVAIDYFTKWVEACSFKNVTQVAVTRFVKNNIICRYGMPEMLITDNASNLNNRMMDQLCQQFKIQHHNSAPYRPKMNGAVEAANKNVKKILSKMTETYKDWHEHLPYALLLPVEVEIPSLRILSQTQLEEAEWAQARYEQLNFIDEKRLAALCPRTALPETDRKSLQQEGSTSHFPTRRSRSEEEEYGPIRSTRKVRTII